MIFLRVFKHLLPQARAWRLTVDKRLRQLFQGLAGSAADVRVFVDRVWSDLLPQQTRELSEWETQWGLRGVGLNEQQRRDRLAAAWRALGGQDPRYIQDTLQANGFDVYVHEWWEPGSEPALGVQACATPRNPLLYLRRDSTGRPILVECGELFAECGEPSAEAGNSLSPAGYPLVNRVFPTTPGLIALAGEEFMLAGEEEAESGQYEGFQIGELNYAIPNDAATWPYFLYIGGRDFPELAVIDPKRRQEFEGLCLKICPLQQWIGILVTYN